tara:strand:- start:1034 stop:1726 length:693 start_codon:yes stop_codon:yes gene_type:complete
MENQKPLSFADIISSSVANLRSGSLITLSDIFLALFASLLCAAIISYTYKKSYQGVLYQKSFNLSLILITLITTAVIMVISGNLVLSLGMVGALSIIRFRSAVKDPIDIVFMFWAVSIGIANGVAAFKVSFVSTIVIAILIMVVKKLPLSSKSFILIIKGEPENEDKLLKTLSAHTSQYYLKSKSINNNQLEIIFEINVTDQNKLTNSISRLSGVTDVNILSSSSNVLDN